LLFFVAVIFACVQEPSTQTASKRGDSVKKAAADFTVSTLSGAPFSLSGNKGKAVLVSFWATWCPPCVWEIPHLAKIYDELNGKGFEIIALSVDRDRGEVLKFIREKNVNFPVAFATQEIVSNYGGVSAIPTNVLVDKDGFIAGVFVGARDENFWRQQIEKLIGG